MKAQRGLLFAMLIIFSIQGDDFSIKKMLNYLYSSGYYDLLLDIKIYFGIDPAINCYQKYVSQYKYKCSEAVKIYIIKQDGVVRPYSINSNSIYNLSLAQIKKQFTNILSKIKASQNFKNQIKKMFNAASQKGKIKIIYNLKVFDILRKKKSEAYILNYIQKKIK